MSDFPFSIPRRVDAQTPPFSFKQTRDTAEFTINKWSPTNGKEVKITQLSGLLITPNSESQKVILQLHLFGEWNVNPYHCNVSFKRIVGSVQTWLDPRAESGIGDRRPCNAVFALTIKQDTTSTPETLNSTFVDEPNTTEEVTYEVYILQTSNDGAKYYLNRSVNDIDTIDHERGISTFTAECKG